MDRLAVEEFGLPTLVLMENAAAALAGFALALRAARVPGRPVVIVCGRGSNGGDGLALARHLSNAGVAVRILLADPPEAYAGDAALHLGVARAMGLAPGFPGAGRAAAALAGLTRRGGVVVDALFGTGLSRPASGVHAEFIAAINLSQERGCAVLSVDVPSGLDADSGRPLQGGPAVRADLTVSLAGLKRGFIKPGADVWLGEVALADIGVPAELLRRLGRPIATGRRRAPGRPADPGEGIGPARRRTARTDADGRPRKVGRFVSARDARPGRRRRTDASAGARMSKQ